MGISWGYNMYVYIYITRNIGRMVFGHAKNNGNPNNPIIMGVYIQFTQWINDHPPIWICPTLDHGHGACVHAIQYAYG